MVPDQRTRVIQPVGTEEVCRTGALPVEIRRVIRCPIHAKGQQVARIQLVIQPPIILGRSYGCGIRELDQFNVGNPIEAVSDPERAGRLSELCGAASYVAETTESEA